MTIPIQDRVMIGELFGRYAHTIDDGDIAGWGDCFAADAELHVFGKTVTGQEALKAMAMRVFETNGGLLRHSMTNIIVDRIEADRADARAYGLVTDWKDSPTFSDFAVYKAALQRADGQWRFRRLDIRLLNQKK